MPKSEWFNEEQEDYIESLAQIPREQRCASGWHIIAKEKCDCEGYKVILPPVKLHLWCDIITPCEECLKAQKKEKK